MNWPQKAKKAGLQINAEKTKVMKNGYASAKSVYTDGTIIKEVDEYVYLGHLVGMNNSTDKEIRRRCIQAWQAFNNAKDIFKSDMPLCLKRHTFNQCILPVLTYGCEVWKTTKKQRNKLQVTQRAMERAMLKITRRDRKKNSWLRQQTKVADVLETAAKLKWSWAGHVARRHDGRWTKLVTEWYPRDEKRRQGRQRTRWEDSIRKVAGTTWMRDAQDRRGWRSHKEAFIQQWIEKG